MMNKKLLVFLAFIGSSIIAMNDSSDANEASTDSQPSNIQQYLIPLPQQNGSISTVKKIILSFSGVTIAVGIGIAIFYITKSIIEDNEEQDMKNYVNSQWSKVGQYIVNGIKTYCLNEEFLFFNCDTNPEK